MYPWRTHAQRHGGWHTHDPKTPIARIAAKSSPGAQGIDYADAMSELHVIFPGGEVARGAAGWRARAPQAGASSAWGPRRGGRRRWTP